MGLNINQPPFPGEFHTKGCVWQHTFLITGGKRGLSIALIYYCVLNLIHFFLRGSRRGKQAIIVIVASRAVWLTKNVPSTLTSEREEQISELCSVVSDLSVTTVSLTELGFISPVSTARLSARASLAEQRRWSVSRASSA